MIVKLSFLLPYSGQMALQTVEPDIPPSIELALTNCAQSITAASGICSQDDIDSGIRRYTWAEESLSTWNQTSCGQAYLIRSSSERRAETRFRTRGNTLKTTHSNFPLYPAPCTRLPEASLLRILVNRSSRCGRWLRAVNRSLFTSRSKEKYHGEELSPNRNQTAEMYSTREAEDGIHVNMRLREWFWVAKIGSQYSRCPTVTVVGQEQGVTLWRRDMDRRDA